MMASALQWLALALLGAAMIGAFGAITARSLFVACMHLVAAGAAVAAVVLLLGADEGALGIALVAAAWTPLLLLAAMLLSARAAKSAPLGAAVLGWSAAALAAALVWWPLAELQYGAPVASQAASPGLGFWIAPLPLVAALTCLGLLGFGERGALARGDAR